MVDDGSSDRSKQLCEAITDERVRCYSNSNHGVSYTRNFGVQKATGEWIMFLDADDLLAPNALEALASKIHEPDTDLVIGGFCKQYLDGGRLVREEAFFTNAVDFEMSSFDVHAFDLMQQSLIQGPCYKLFRRDVVLCQGVQFPLDMSYGEDTVFVYRYFAHVRRVCVVEDIVYSYRFFRADSLSGKFREDKLDIHLKLNNMLRDLIANRCGALNAQTLLEMALLDANALFMFFNQLQHTDMGYFARKEHYRKYAACKQICCALRTVKRVSLKYRVIAICLQMRLWRLLDYLFCRNQRHRR